MAGRMTLAELTALLSRVGKRYPGLMISRDSQLLIEAIIEEGRKLPAEKVPRAPVDEIDI
jgi:hypothetical protein